MPSDRRKAVLNLRLRMMERGITNVSIARELGLSSDYISKVINSRVKAEKVREEIAKIVGMKPNDIWPEWDWVDPEYKFSPNRRNRQ